MHYEKLELEKELQKIKGMKSKIILLTISLLYFFNYKAFCQDYKIDFEREICECISTSDQESNFNQTLDSQYKRCFKKLLVNYASLIDSETEGTHYEKLRQGDLKRAELLIELRHRLIHSCDYYYNSINTYRDKQYQLIKKNADSSKVQTLTERIALRPDYYGYSERGKLYFALGDFESAISDLLKAKEPLTIAGEINIWLGWAYELSSQYENALKIYLENEKITRLSDIPIKREIVRRKMGLGLTNTDRAKTSKKKKSDTDDLLKLLKKKG